MGSNRRIIGRSMSKERRIRFIGRGSPRLGPNVRIGSVSSIPSSPREQELLNQTIEHLRRIGNNSNGRRTSLVAKIKLLRRFIQMQTSEKIQRPPTVYELLAYTALEHGLNSHKLLTEVKAMRAMAVRHGRRGEDAIPWQGTPGNAYNAIRYVVRSNAETKKYGIPEDTNLVDGIEKVLFHAKNTTLSTQEVATRLGLPWNGASMTLLNASMQLLEVAGLVRKMPYRITPKQRGLMGMWVHAAYENPPITYDNPVKFIIQELAGGKKRLQELFHPRKTFGKTQGTGTLYSDSAIRSSMEMLTRMGLVTTVRKWRKPEVAFLTEEGMRAARALSTTAEVYGEQRHHTPEWIRQIFLGEKHEP